MSCNEIIFHSEWWTVQQRQNTSEQCAVNIQYVRWRHISFWFVCTFVNMINELWIVFCVVLFCWTLFVRFDLVRSSTTSSSNANWRDVKCLWYAWHVFYAFTISHNVAVFCVRICADDLSEETVLTCRSVPQTTSAARVWLWPRRT